MDLNNYLVGFKVTELKTIGIIIVIKTGSRGVGSPVIPLLRGQI